MTEHSKQVKDLKAGDALVLSSAEVATVKRVYRNPLFEGDVWTVEHTQGEDTASGRDLVALHLQ